MSCSFTSTRLISLFFLISIQVIYGLVPQSRPAELVRELQSCFTPDQVLERVGSKLIDLDRYEASELSHMSRLVLVRLSKQWLSLDNQRLDYSDSDQEKSNDRWWTNHDELSSCDQIDNILQTVVRSLTQLSSSPDDPIVDETVLDDIVEATKAFSIIARLVPAISSSRTMLLEFWGQEGHRCVPSLESHQVSGLYWALENIVFSFNLHNEDRGQFQIPRSLKARWKELNLPFHVIPGFLNHIDSLSVQTLRYQVDFGVDEIRTVSNKFVRERRQTSWEGDEGVGPFLYSDKEMPRQDWSPLVRQVRDALANPALGHGQYYDCCLLNLYPDGGSGMRYHIDPDQGTLWDFDTVVVSVGASRRFSFRRISEDDNQEIHSFTVMHSDTTYMFADCQQQFQHTVKKAENKKEQSPRSSLVFKRSWGR